MAGVYDWFTVLSESYVIGQNALEFATLGKSYNLKELFRQRNCDRFGA